MLLDANVLLYAVDAASPFHERARDWMNTTLNGTRRIGLPWPSLLAFLRISTHPRATPTPLPADAAWRHVQDWLDADVTWVPLPTAHHGPTLAELIDTHHVTGNLVTDAHFAALALEHGLTVVSSDSDFARFPEVRWHNPLLPDNDETSHH